MQVDVWLRLVICGTQYEAEGRIMNAERSRISTFDCALLGVCFVADIGILLYTAWMHHGARRDKSVLGLLPLLVLGGLFVIRGILSLNETWKLDASGAGDIREEDVSISRRYTATMLIYGVILLLAVIAGGLLVLNLNSA